MIKNSTLKFNITTIVEKSLTNYETTGAIIYIIVVLLWYSVGIVFMLGIQMSTRSEENEDSVRRRTRTFIRNINDHNNKKEILEELVDKQNRDRLWNIYLGESSDDTKDYLIRAETVRIRHIKKKLAAIKRNYHLAYDALLLPSTHNIHYARSRSENRSETFQLSWGVTSSRRRHSSLDQQTLDQLKQLTNQSKFYDQLPWTIRKYIIQR
ncbi:unnamed protein product [Rotaria sp. Silwood2]|nr:unnamed protein product [Rotaria sp. Silwood2]CAF2758055.1 unnamed protein product [Rotaria sp. Silwood2]CAF3162442.1 unnamed protein product [Rotaria sp. Silwood2]CAF3174803.1 unnamed protein product [Rotaria sp. Silwood2]CAF3852771.1 unnamed protein product [Rotaria sp. Silwood2]